MVGARVGVGLGEEVVEGDLKLAALEQLADANAFLGLGLARRQALWTIRGLDDTELPLMIAAGVVLLLGWR
jgi:hypothetical protein